MSKLLIEESPLTFQPSLAVAIGLNEAIVLQQIHYWIKNTKNKGYEQDGYKWVYNTYAEWKESNFPFWSENTIQRTFASLEEKGLVVSIQPMKGKYDRTKYYRIEYTKLEVFDDPKMVCSLNESEITTENTTERKDVTPTLDSKNKDQSVDYPFDMQEVIKEANLAMDRHLDVELFNAPGIKAEARRNSILSYLGERLHVNTETKTWREFAKYVDGQQQKGEKIETFIAWLLGQDGFQIQYWPPRRMMELWPQAFIKTNVNSEPKGTGYYG